MFVIAVLMHMAGHHSMLTALAHAHIHAHAHTHAHVHKSKSKHMHMHMHMNTYAHVRTQNHAIDRASGRSASRVCASV